MRIRSGDFSILAAALLLSTQVGCGGGGGSSSDSPATPTNPPTSSPSPSSSTQTVSGTITGFGSVFVNGRRYDTDDAEIFIDGASAAEDDLSIGMVVRVQADDDDRASLIAYDEVVEGPIDEISADSLVVLGQTIITGPNTTFDDIQRSDLMVGDVVEISGLRNADDAIEASYVEREDDADEYEVTGFIRELDEDNQTFRIGGLTIDFSTASLDDLGELRNDLLVEVEDDQLAYSPGDLRLIATEIEGLSPFAIDDDIDGSRDDDDGEFDDDFDDVDIEGLITEIIDDSSFRLNGILVVIDEQTNFEFGSAEQITVGARVEVEGAFIDGQLLAEDIEFEDNIARIDGLVSMIDFDNVTITVLGVTVSLANVEFDDDVDDQAFASIDDLQVGDFVEIEGIETDSGLLATEIERDDDDDAQIRGFAQQIDGAAGSLELLGVMLTTDASTEYEINDSDVSAEAFFQALVAGQSIVEAQWDGIVTDPSVPLRELELEQDD